jgi:DNA-binding NarL/FixJ family response regulator
MIRLMLVDDQPAVRRALRMRLALEADLEIVGEAGSGTEAVALVPILAPDVVLMDVHMPHMDGIEATEALRVAAPGVAVLILSLHDDAATQARALAAGARGFIEKRGGVEALLDAIHETTAATTGQPSLP